jgi:hypothetical protein
MGRVAWEPTRKRVVLKFSYDMRNDTASPPIMAGFRYLNVI